eukprot:2864303-Rhodomonas_salina.2
MAVNNINFINNNVSLADADTLSRQFFCVLPRGDASSGNAAKTESLCVVPRKICCTYLCRDS